MVIESKGRRFMEVMGRRGEGGGSREEEEEGAYFLLSLLGNRGIGGAGDALTFVVLHNGWLCGVWRWYEEVLFNGDG